MLKSKWILALAAGLLGVGLAACGPSAAQQAATSTQIAANIFSTQTAGAPTATATFTPSATPSNTPTPTATPTVTLTPTPSDTPTPTATPTPVLSVLALTLDDLPAGFESLDEDSLRTMQKSMPDDSFPFGFNDVISSQAIIGVLIPLPTRAGQAAFDTTLQPLVDATISGLGTTAGTKVLRGYEEVGEARAANSVAVKTGALTLQWNVIAFRRGSVGVLLLVGHPAGDKPARPPLELAQLLDKRISQFIATTPTGFARP